MIKILDVKDMIILDSFNIFVAYPNFYDPTEDSH